MKVRWLDRQWVRIGLTLALIAGLFAIVGPASIWDTVKASRWQPLLVGLLSTPAVIGIKSLRWFLLARTQGDMSFWEALRSYLAGLTLATLTPLAAGEAGRGLFVRTGDRAGLTGKVILDKLVDLFTVGVFAGIGLMLTAEQGARTVGALVVACVAIVGGGTLLLLPNLKGRFAGMEQGWLARLRAPAIIEGLASTPRLQLALTVALSLVGFVIFYGQAFVLMRAFWAEASWTVVPYFPIITLSTILPIAVGGVGIREWTAVLLLRRFGVTDSVAFSTFFAHFVIVQLLPALGGAFIVGSFRREDER